MHDKAHPDFLATPHKQGIDDSAGGVQRILRSKNDMKKGMTAEDAALGEEEEEDDDEAFEGLLEGDEAMEAYKFGETSGSKLVDRMRKKEERERRASNAALSELAGSGASLDKMGGARRVSQADSLAGHTDASEMTPRSRNGDGDGVDAGRAGGGSGWAGASAGMEVGLALEDEADDVSAVGYTSSPWAKRGAPDGGHHSNPRSPSAPSTPLPSSPSFQAQSRRNMVASPKGDHDEAEQSTSEPETTSNSGKAATRASVAQAAAATADSARGMRGSFVSVASEDGGRKPARKARGN